MKNGQCPKCGSHDVYAGTQIGFKQGALATNTIPLGGLFSASAALDNYVCVNCGYVESYVADPDKLRIIARRWPKVRSG
ncbi:MAG: hypothetical protein H8E35_13785 [Ardenticatenia bacterium]|nr:hypothetical protein [Ardenticatenia bacterium]